MFSSTCGPQRCGEGVELKNLVGHLDGLLDVNRFRDYAPNGLQVEGSARVHRVVAGVTACQALLDRAVELDADAVLVHHGYFWRNEPLVLTGIRRRRIATLLAHDMSLLAYHLPLDAHPELGNNAGLGRLLGVSSVITFGDQSLACAGDLDEVAAASTVASRLEEALGRAPLLLGEPSARVRRIGWCTGGAQGFFADAIAAGVDLFVTGEVSESCAHLAAESGVAFVAAGHHATERFGVRSLCGHLQDVFGLDCHFVDISNPV